MFIIGSVYALPEQNLKLCLTKDCQYDSSLWFFIGCLCFLYGNTIKLFSDYSFVETEQKRILIANVFGSLTFLAGSVVYIINFRQQGTFVFFMGSCIFIVTTSYDYLKFRNKKTLVFLTGSMMFIIGDIVSNKTMSAILWLTGSILFTIGTFLGLSLFPKEHKLVPRDIELV